MRNWLRSQRLQAFGYVENLLDKDPDLVSVSILGSSPYDTVGRDFGVGLRFEFQGPAATLASTGSAAAATEAALLAGPARLPLAAARGPWHEIRDTGNRT